MIVVVPVDPPREGLVLTGLVESTPLSENEAIQLYEAAVTDVVRTAVDSGGDLLVNYRDEETLPDEVADGDSEEAVRALVTDALEETDTDSEAVRFERQVGSSKSARIGNTVTHLLEREGVDGVGVLEPTAPAVKRSDIDGAAMGLRRHDVVLGPSSDGRTYLAAFTDPIDFEDAYAPFEFATLANRVDEAGLDLGFAPMVPTLATPGGLRSTIATLEARAVASRLTATATAVVVDDLEISVGEDGDLERAETDNHF
ncbi:glycosyltransferase family protein [Natronobacterium gregoryi]|uniref:DUF2064 domain-containing protein n=2 Tax=Natronobacterium gregoryi TaxID=44930 RepID=L0AMS7_NATGS|nr:hypothetical protein [Natronobacterium gregoryi]AFZ74502.1 hypothetical protein Natgr_3381 [Natronobacterium gregoryi SP2]ELY72424.1 hypothetical protein C490_03733 [Natronobacterium gregoryi SP2]PLK21752.1 hypothetical protein CYV19_02645 [Natronobacterium gregoryi SP2]SFI98397.1 hypothetical protein SAMN05443661_110206 [Natronobacterium gregoryi]